jgi:hypothetical protein
VATNDHGLTKQINGPMENADAVTPSDSTDLTYATRAIYVGVTGDVKVDMARRGTVTFKALQAGVVHWIAANRIYSTGTTATNIVALY